MKRHLISAFLLIIIAVTFFNSCKDNNEPVPSILSVEPDHAATGESVTITGQNFTADAVVSFNGAVATVTNAANTQLIVTVPANATSGMVTVKAHGQVAQGPAFTLEVPPTISSITPQSAKAGDQVSINGNNFSSTATANTVKFNGTPATVSSATVTQLVVTVPSGVTSGPVTVEVNGRMAQGPNFTVIPPVTITNVTPSSAATCASVTITGTNFSTTPAENVVKFNGVIATVNTASSTQLVVTVPVATSGAITVTTNSQTATSANFTVLVSEATMTMDAIDYTYSNFCGYMVGNNYWVSASGGFTSPKPSWVVQFNGARPATAGTYSVQIAAERPGETWDFTPATVNVSFDNQSRMVISFTNITLNGRSGTAPKAFSGVVSVY